MLEVIPKAFGLPNIGKTLYYRWYCPIRLYAKACANICVGLFVYTCPMLPHLLVHLKKNAVLDVDIHKKSYLCKKVR